MLLYWFYYSSSSAVLLACVTVGTVICLCYFNFNSLGLHSTKRFLTVVVTSVTMAMLLSMPVGSPNLFSISCFVRFNAAEVYTPTCLLTL